jgi:hypothetical protein
MASDIFISYAHSDDETPDGQPGIVTELKKDLEVYGRQKCGRKLEIFFDKDLASGTSWEEKLSREVKSASIFLPVFSPTWVNSTWGAREWRLFWEQLNRPDSPAEQNRIIPVAFEMDSDDQNEILTKTQLSVQIRHRLGHLMLREQRKSVAIQVGKEVRDFLRAQGKLPQPTPDPPDGVGQKPLVLLGYAFSPRMKDWRGRLQQDLTSKGFTVAILEHEGWPTFDNTKQQIADGLSRCDSIVHFLEESPGPYAGRDQLTVVQLQCELAEEPSAERIKKFYWIGPDLKPDAIADTSHKEFVRSRPCTNESVTAFAKKIDEELTRVSQQPSPKPEGRPIICVIAESGDQDVVDEIRRYFAGIGLPITVPDLSVEQRAISASYSTVFKDNEYFLFYWGQGSKQWCHVNVEDFLRARRTPSGTIRDPAAAVLYFAAKREKYKDDYKWVWREIRTYDRFDPTALREFIADVANRMRARSEPGREGVSGEHQFS